MLFNFKSGWHGDSPNSKKEALDRGLRELISRFDEGIITSVRMPFLGPHEQCTEAEFDLVTLGKEVRDAFLKMLMIRPAISLTKPTGKSMKAKYHLSVPDHLLKWRPELDFASFPFRGAWKFEHYNESVLGMVKLREQLDEMDFKFTNSENKIWLEFLRDMTESESDSDPELEDAKKLLGFGNSAATRQCP